MHDHVVVGVLMIIGGLALSVYSQRRCTVLDVQTGRRDPHALIDDYGSNRGWYWPWSAFAGLGFVMAFFGIVWIIAQA